MMLKFQSNATVLDPDHFLEFLKNCLTAQACEKICTSTAAQSDCHEWFAARFGRITASKIYDVVHCDTYEGTTMEAVLGAKKFVQSTAMKRGLMLEKPVLDIICQERNITVQKTGLHIKPEFPIFAASPDGISDEFCIEIKSPSKETTVKKYLKVDGQVVEKHYAQMQLQMLLCGRQKSLFCVAAPSFESDKNITTVEVHFDDDYCKKMISTSIKFWKRAIFPKLIDIPGSP